jgi:hypothetical protein
VLCSPGRSPTFELVNRQDVPEPPDVQSLRDPDPPSDEVRTLQDAAAAPSNTHSASAAVESLDTVKALIDTVLNERSRAVAAEESHRRTEVERVRLEAELKAEREARKRLEEELKRYRLDAGEAGDERSSGAVSGVLMEERERREQAESELQRLIVEAKARRQRVRDELEHLRETGVDDESRQRLRAGLERLMGESIESPGSDSGLRPPVEARLDESGSGAPPPPPGEEPPLPPGWRYASNLLPDKPRSRWWRGTRSKS